LLLSGALNTSLATIFKRQFQDAAQKLLLAIQENPGSPVPYRFLSARYAHLQRLDEAHALNGAISASAIDENSVGGSCRFNNGDLVFLSHCQVFIATPRETKRTANPPLFPIRGGESVDTEALD
jgi:hypothetical protein